MKQFRMQNPVLIFLCFILMLLYISKEYLGHKRSSISNLWNDHGNTKPICRFPSVDPFDSEVQEALLDTVEEMKFTICKEKSPYIFQTDEKSNLLLVENPGNFNLTDCFYRLVIRDFGSDDKIHYDSKIYMITEKVTKIPLWHEYIAIQCKNMTNSSHIPFIDMFAFAPLNNVEFDYEGSDRFDISSKTERRQVIVKSSEDSSNDWDFQKRPNVVVLMLDSIAHMSFIRTMPRTFKFLKEHLGAVGLKGFSKIGENTIPNMLPFLTGKSYAETESATSCVPTITSQFDNCTFLWKNFESQGYVTSFEEDALQLSTFNFRRKGFKNKPTDSYIRPLLIAMIQENQVKRECFGPRNRMKVLINQMKKVAFSSNVKKNRPYFQFVVSNGAHENNAYALTQDRSLLDFLKWFEREGLFKKSIFLILSDHGSRWGKVANTQQGFVEKRMPFAYFVFPKWFRVKYHNAIENLRENTQRLTTHYDLHESLKDLLHLGSMLSNKAILKRTKHLKTLDQIPRGISLFLPVPSGRTCSMAGISGAFCLCNFDKSLRIEPTSLTASLASRCALIEIKKKVHAQRDICEELRLHLVVAAWAREDEGYSMTVDVVFETLPKRARFEATLMMDKRFGRDCKVVGDVTRIDTYQRTGRCVKSRVLKTFCICK